MSDSEAELATVADLIEVAHVRLVHLLGTHAVQPKVRTVLDRLAVDALRRGDPDNQPTPLSSPRPVVEVPQPHQRKTNPSTPKSKRPGRR